MFNKQKQIATCIILQKDEDESYKMIVAPYQEPFLKKKMKSDYVLTSKYENLKKALEEALKIKDNLESQTKVKIKIIID